MPDSARPSQRQRRRDELAFVRSVLRSYLSAESGPVGTYPLRSISYRKPRNPMAVAMVSRGEMGLSPPAHRLLGELVQRPGPGSEPAHHQWSPKAWAAAKDVVTTLTHEAIHFVDEDPRDPRVAEDAVVRSRGIRAVEEGATELQTHRRVGQVIDQLHSDDWLDDVARTELKAATPTTATPHFVSAVQGYLSRTTETDSEFDEAIDRLNRVDAPDKPGVLADVLLDKSDLGRLVTQESMTQIRTEVSASIVRELDDVTDRKRPPPGYVTGKAAVRAAVERGSGIVDRYQSIAFGQERIETEVAQAHARFARAELDAGKDVSSDGVETSHHPGLAAAHAELTQTLNGAQRERGRLAEQLADLTHELGASSLQHHWDQHAAAKERSQILRPTTFDEANAATQMENYAGLQRVERQRLATNVDRGGRPTVSDERFRSVDPDRLPRDLAGLRADGHARLAAAQATATSPPRADLTGAGPTRIYVPGDQPAGTPTDGLRRTGPSPAGAAWAGVAPPGSNTRAGGASSARPNQPGPRSRRPRGHER